MQRLARWNDLDGLTWARNRVSSTTGTGVEVMAADAASSWGILPDFVICDEVCHWTNREFWQSLYSSAGKQEHCILVCLSNAGVGYDWQWDLRQNAQANPDWYFHSLDGPQAPWITEQMLAEQRAMLPGPVYARLWLNEWQAGDGEYLSLEEARACCDPSLRPQTHGDHRTQYLGVIDYAEKHDLTAAAIAHYDAARRRVVIDRMDVVKPSPLRPTPVAWVEAWMHRAARNFAGIEFVIDDWQLLALCQRLSAQYLIERIAFHSGHTNQVLAQHLRQQVLTRQIAWHPECGRVPRDDGVEDTLETELSQLVTRQTAAGFYRFESRSDGRSHDDRSFVVGMASLTLSDRDNTPTFALMQEPLANGTFAPMPAL